MVPVLKTFVRGVKTSAMRTSGPTARSAHAFSHFIETDFYAAVPGLVLLGGCDPAYPLIARQRRNARPKTGDNRVRLDRLAKIFRHPVHRTGSNRLSSHGSVSLQVDRGSGQSALTFKGFDHDKACHVWLASACIIHILFIFQACASLVLGRTREDQQSAGE